MSENMKHTRTHWCVVCKFETESEVEAYAHDCMGKKTTDGVAAAQAVVDEYTRRITDLTTQRNKFMDSFGRCDRWLDGHSDNRCRRLRGHEGRC